MFEIKELLLDYKNMKYVDVVPIQEYYKKRIVDLNRIVRNMKQRDEYRVLINKQTNAQQINEQTKQI